MGYIRHKAFVLCSWDEKKAKQWRDWVIDKLKSSDTAIGDMSNIVTSIIKGINGYCSFAILPDGSKEWWPPSDYVDNCIEKLIESIKDEYHITWGYMQFYDEEGMATVRTSMQEQENEE